MQTIVDAKYLIETTESQGTRIWKISHRTDSVLICGEIFTYDHWYELVYGDKIHRFRIWTPHPFKESFFREIIEGEYQNTKIIFDSKEVLALKLKYGI